MLPTNVAQALVILVAIVVGFVLPITAPQILWVNMVTSVALGLVISFEPHELDVMQRPPRAVSRPILNRFAIWRVIFVGLALLILTLWAFFWMKSQDAADELARAVAVNTLVIGQVFYLFNSRFKTDSSLSIAAHLGNRYVPMGVGAVVLLQLLFTYAPPFQQLFGTAAIPLDVWPWLFLGGLIFFLIVEAEKFVIRAYQSRRSSPVPETPAEPIPLELERAIAQDPSRLAPGRAGKWQALLGGVAVLALIAGEVYSFLHRDAADQYATADVGQSAATSEEPATETADGLNRVNFGARVSGKIEALFCEPDARVKAGQLCGKIDPRPFEAAVDREKAALDKAQLQRDKNASALLRAQKDFQRKQDLAARGATSRSALDRSRVIYESAKARNVADEAEVARLQKTLAAAQNNLALTDIVSPIDGTVVSRNAEVSQRVEVNQEPPLFVLAPNSGAMRE
jgi:biotin carboxyl carrier protein